MTTLATGHGAPAGRSRRNGRFMGQQKTTGWARLAVLSLAMGGLLGSALGGILNCRPRRRRFPRPLPSRRPSAACPTRPPRPAAPRKNRFPRVPQPSPLRPSDGRDPLAGQSELSAEALVTEVELPRLTLEAAAAACGAGRGAISPGDLPGRPDVWFRAVSGRSGTGRQWRLDG